MASSTHFPSKNQNWISKDFPWLNILSFRVAVQSIVEFRYSIGILLYYLLFLGFWLATYDPIYSSTGSLYSSIDGQLCAWYTKAIVEWSSPLDTSILNPFQGMVSLFFTNSPWWNPGALVLSLPIPEKAAFILSYSIYWFESFFSVYFLARTLKLSKAVSFFSAQLFVFFAFPPFVYYWLSSLQLAPFNAHLLALANFILILYAKLGEGGSDSNSKRKFHDVGIDVGIIVLIVFLIFITIMSSTLTIITYLPTYGLIGLGLTFHAKNKRSMLIKIVTILGIMGLLFSLRSFEFYQGTIAYSAANLGIQNITFNFPKIWKGYDCCGYYLMNLYCIKYHAWKFRIPGLLGGLLCFMNVKNNFRWVAAFFCIAALLPESINILYYNDVIQGGNLRPQLDKFVWPTYTFFSIYFVVFLLFVFQWLKFSNLFHYSNILFSYLKPVALILAMPIFIAIAFFYLPKQPLSNNEIPKTAIIEYLQDNISIKPGREFRGSVATFIAGEDSPLRVLIDPNNPSGAFKSSYYTYARAQLKILFGNAHMFSDLWKFNIPSIEEYGQWITVPLMYFFKEMFTKPEDLFYRNFLNIYRLDPKVLSALGVRFIITDKKLNDKQLKLVLTQKPTVGQPYVDMANSMINKSTNENKNYDFSLYLYEIINSNLANYSPTQMIVSQNITEIFSILRRKDFSYADTMIVQEPFSIALLPAKNTKLSFERNEIVVQGESNGWSSVLLPVQYSHCFSVESKLQSTLPDTQNTLPILMRANLVQTALIFKDKLDVTLRFNFGIGNNSACRKQDLEDISNLGLDPATIEFKQEYY